MTSMMANVNYVGMYDSMHYYDNDQNNETLNRIVVPRRCVKCNKMPCRGVAYYVLVCHSHVICRICLTGEQFQNETCPVCDDIQRQEEQAQDAHYYTRNTLPITALANTCAIRMEPNSRKYKYPQINQPGVSDKVILSRTIELSQVSSRMWPAGFGDNIIIGGWQHPVLNVVSPDGKIVRHTLSCGIGIVSGILIKEGLHAVIINYSGYWYDVESNKLHLVQLDRSTTTTQILHPLRTLNVYGSALLFSASTQLCGVLCMNGSCTPYSAARIRIFGLDNLTLHLDADRSILQSTALWGRRTLIHLDVPEPHSLDTVCTSPRGQYCVMSYLRGEVRVYNKAGAYMHTVGKPREWSTDAVLRGHLYFPRSIQCTEDFTLVIVGSQGDIQRYNLDSKAGVLQNRLVSTFSNSYVNYSDISAEYSKRLIDHHKEDPSNWYILNGIYKKNCCTLWHTHRLKYVDT